MPKTLTKVVILFILLLPFSLSAQLGHWFPNCNSVEVIIDNNVSLPCSNCYWGDFPYTPGERARSLFRIERKNGFVYEVVDDRRNRGDGRRMRFNNLTDGTYRVTAFRIVETPNNFPTGGSCLPAFRIDGRRLGCDGSTEFIGQFEVELGFPSSDPVLLAPNGSPSSNNEYCEDEVLPGDGLILEPNAFGGTKWRIDIDMLRADGSSRNYRTSGWNDGSMPESIDILNEVWRVGNTWRFWASSSDGAAGTRYRVRVVQSKPTDCTGWQPEEIFFRVFPSSTGCRPGNFDDDLSVYSGNENLDLAVFPNPADGEIRIRGLEQAAGAVNYQILDLSGRLLRTQSLQQADIVIPTTDLMNGTYLLQLELADGYRTTKRFVVSH
ncbi:MAG: T9SS type A sorting domain-containing protein [Bacteroidota bacterium]